MAKTVGIIAEYNPFHNGHYYHLQKAKQIFVWLLYLEILHKGEKPQL